MTLVHNFICNICKREGLSCNSVQGYNIHSAKNLLHLAEVETANQHICVTCLMFFKNVHSYQNEDVSNDKEKNN